MGVKLKELINRETIDFSQLAGNIIAVDAPNIIMGLLNFSRKNRADDESPLIVDRTQQAISHLYGLLYRINFFYNKNIFPIFCFDGRDSELKRIITKDMLNDFQYTKQRYQEAILKRDKTLAKQIAMSKEYFWPNIMLESKNLLGLLGVPYIESPASAESQCAELVKRGLADYSNSQDYDSLLFGCPKLIQNLSKSLRRKQHGRWIYTKIVPNLINLNSILKNLEINQFQLVDLAILIGTDYFPGIKGIGPKKALDLIKKHGNVEFIVLHQKKKYNFTQLTPEIIKKVRKIFLFPEILEKFEDIFWNKPNISRILEFLCKGHHLNIERVEKHLNNLNSNYLRCRNYFLNKRKSKNSIQKSLELFL